MLISSIGLALIMVEIDEDYKFLTEESFWFNAGGAENARIILSSIASSMITVAGVVFSITIVALVLSSTRLLRTFMKDSSTQIGLVELHS